jgi:hypothetical protein
MGDESGHQHGVHRHAGARTDTIRTVAGHLHERSADADFAASKARAAEVDRMSWGPLGFELGLWAEYRRARDGAERSIGEIRAFLSDAKDALHASAEDYDRWDRDTHQLLARILRSLDESS